MFWNNRRTAVHGREEQLRDEMHAHIQAETDLLIARGLSPEAARSDALRRFGNMTQSVEDSRSVWVSQFADQLRQDLAYALRTFRRSTLFSLTALLVIAIGIGASTAVFSFLDRLFLRSLPYVQPSQLVGIGITAPILDFDFLFANDYLYLRQSNGPFSQLTSWTAVPQCDLTEERPLSLACAQVESTFLPTLGITPLAGRNFTATEDRPDAPKVALLSFGFWASRFGSSPAVLGRTISVDGGTVRIIGVLPPTFEFPSLARVDLLVPQALRMSSYAPGQSGRALHVIGRLKPSVSKSEALARLQPFFRFQLQSTPANFRKEIHPALRSLRDGQAGSWELTGWLLTGATLAMLLISAANVAAILLARNTSRSRELAIRASLGAARGRIVRQLITESLLLSLIGGAAGCAFALLLIRIFKVLAPTGIPRLAETALDARVLLFAFAVSLLSGLLFALAPALAVPRQPQLSSRSELGAAPRNYLRHALVAAQLALSLTLLSVSGLLLQSLQKLSAVNYGLQSEHVVLADLSVSFKRYASSAARSQFFDALLERLRALPGTSAVALSDTVPPAGFVHSRPFTNFAVNGHRVEVVGTGGMVAWRSVTPEYLKALGIPLLYGRAFREDDRSSQSNDIILSDSLARRLFAHSNPIGSHLQLFPQSPAYQVIGVAADVRNAGLSQQQDPEYYVLRKKITDPDQGRDNNIMSRAVHFYDGQASLIVRSAAHPDSVAATIRQELSRLDPTTPVAISTLDSRVASLSEGPRFNAVLLSAFAFVGLTLASVGLYGLISFVVAQRRPEIGVRIAVGATPKQIGALVLGHALRWTVLGLTVGLLCSLTVARWLASLLYEVRPRNPAPFLLAALILFTVASAASFVPSWRAARIDPIDALRRD